MALPTWQAAGTMVEGTGAISPAWPAGQYQAGDIGILIVESCGGEAATLSTAAGFTAITNSPQNTGTTTNGTRLTAWWCRATSGAMSSPTVADPGNHAIGQIVVVRGCVALGNPFETTAGNVKAAASTSCSWPAVTTTVRDCLIMHILTHDVDSLAASQVASSVTNASLANLTERVDESKNSGNGGGIVVYTGGLATPGPTGTTSGTITSSINAMLTIAFMPSYPDVITTTGNKPRQTVQDSTYVYACTDDTTLRVIRVRKDDWTTKDELTISGRTNGNSIIDDGTYLYVGCYENPANIVRILKSDFATTSTLTLSTGETQIRHLAQDSTYIYAVLDVNPAKVVRVLKSDFSTRSTKTFGTGDSFAYSAHVDGNYLYVGCFASPGKIVRLDLTDFNTFNVFTFPSGYNDVLSITSDATNIYATLNQNPTAVIRILKSDFSTWTFLRLNLGQGGSYLASDTDRLYVTSDSSPGKYAVIEKSTFPQVVPTPTTFSENGASKLSIDTNYAYVPLYLSPGKIRRVRILIDLEQEGFRWRSDDGSETTATWLEVQDTNLTRAKNQNTRLRMLLNTGAGPTFDPYQLEYRPTGGTWKPVPLNATTYTVDLCNGGTVTASVENTPNEGKEKAFDNNFTSTKWLLFASTGWIAYQFLSAQTINKYTLTSGNDEPTRDPKNWEFQGSNNGSTWTTIDTRTNETFGSRGLTREFTFTNTTPYSYYRLNITANNGASGIMQLAEIEMMAYEASPIMLSASGNIGASGASTTAQLTAPSGKSTSDFQAGRIQDDENPSDSVALDLTKYTEMEWCLIANNEANGVTYEFRVTVGGVPLDAYTVTPQWTVQEPAANAVVSPVGLTLTVPSVTATHHSTAAVDPVGLSLVVPPVTATHQETAAVSPLVFQISVPTVAAIAIHEAAVDPIVLQASVPTVSATYEDIDIAMVAPVGLQLAVPSVIATYEEPRTAEVAPVVLVMSLPSVSATIAETAAAAPISLALSIPSVTAENVATASVAPVAISAIVPSVSASHHETMSVAPVSLALAIPSVLATYVQIETANVDPIALILSVPSVQATFAATAAVAPIGVLLSVPPVSASYVQVETSNVDPVSLLVSLPVVAASHHSSASVNPISLLLTVPGVTASVDEVQASSVNPLVLSLSLPAVTAGATVQASVDPVSLLLSVPPVVAGFAQTASVAPISIVLTIASVTASGAFVYHASVQPILLALTVSSVTADGIHEPQLLSIKDAIYRELRFSDVLSGLMDVSRVKLDMRPEVDSLRESYPYVVFRRVTSAEANDVRYVRERWEIEVIGRTAQADTLDAISEALADHFGGRRRTWGQFTSDGSPQEGTGLKMKSLHLDTVELEDRTVGELAHIVILLFSYVR